jgi:hypothetical protein
MDIVAKERQRIAEGPPVFDMCQRDQVLGAKLGRDSELAVSRKRNVEYTRNVA